MTSANAAAHDLGTQMRAMRADLQAMLGAISALARATEAGQETLHAILQAVTAEPSAGDPLAPRLQALTAAVEAQHEPLQATADALEALRSELPTAIQRAGELAAEQVLTAAALEAEGDPALLAQGGQI
jgi:prefoldin subunit 5